MNKTLRELLNDGRGSIKTGPFGTSLSASEYSDSGVPIISVGEVDYGKLTLRRDTPKAPADVVNRLPEYVLEEGDIVFARKGAVDRSARVGADQAGWFLGSDGLRVRPGSAVDSLWLAYFLSLRTSREWLLRHAAGTTMLSLSGSTLGDIPVDYPTRKTQSAIAAVLGAIDDKIAANTAVAETADALSEARFAALEKPTVAPLTEVARFINGKAFTKDASGSGRVVIRIAELNSGIGNSTVYSDIEVANDHTARSGDLLFAWSGSLTVHRWYRPEAIINQHIFKVMPRDGYPMWLANQALRSRLSEFKSIASDKATTMGHIQRRHVEEPVSLPSRDAIDREAELMDGLWRIALGAETENLTLAELRDTLLPALMSGRLRVGDAQRQVEDAV